MKEMHWSQLEVSFITIEVTYSDTARQGWDYDCSQFPNLEAVQANMANDFLAPRPDWEILMVHASLNDNHASAELNIPIMTGEDFAEYIIENVQEMLNGN